MTTATESTTKEPPAALLTEREFCARYRVSREAAIRFRRDPLDPVPHLKLGRRILYRLPDVERWAIRRAERERRAKKAT